ncbi:hypothetical protein JCM3766R1_005086, partial [Sporobolomyces carnicolor]
MADGTTPTVPGQDKLLAALYACHKRNGKGARVDFALQSLRKRHPASYSQSDDPAFKAAKAALLESGVIAHVAGSTYSISAEAKEAIESWKQQPATDVRDDEQAAAKYLERGRNPKFRPAPEASTSKLPIASTSGSSLRHPPPQAPRPTLGSRTAKNVRVDYEKDSDELTSDGEDSDEGEVATEPKKRAKTGGVARPTKRPKLASGALSDD